MNLLCTPNISTSHQEAIVGMFAMQQQEVNDQDFNTGEIRAKKKKMRFSVHLKREGVAPLFIGFRIQCGPSDPDLRVHEDAKEYVYIH